MQKKKVEIRQIKRESIYFYRAEKKSLRLIKKRHKIVKLWSSGMFFSLIVIA